MQLHMKTWAKVLLTLATLGIIAATAVYFFVYNKPHTNFERAKPDFTISAENLYKAFIYDHVAAEKEYNARVIQITGILNDLEFTDDRVFAIFAFGDGMFGPEGIRCTLLDNHNSALSDGDIGKDVTIKGFCSGFTGTDVILEHCSVLK